MQKYNIYKSLAYSVTLTAMNLIVNHLIRSRRDADRRFRGPITEPLEKIPARRWAACPNSLAQLPFGYSAAVDLVPHGPPPFFPWRLLRRACSHARHSWQQQMPENACMRPAGLPPMDMHL